jgi:CubicO group peptidase (beta-lactamase class C family)
MKKLSRLGLLLFFSISVLSTASFPRETNSQVKKNIELLNSKNTGVRVAAILELGNIGAGAKKAVPLLLRAAEDPEPLVRESVAAALGKIGSADKKVILSLIGRFADEDPFVAGKAVTALANLGGPAGEYLTRSLAAESDNVRWCSAIALGKIAPAGAEAIRPLTAALKDKIPDVRWCSAIALGKFNGEAAPAVPELLALLNDDDRDVRWAAYVSLERIDKGKIGAAPGFPGVIEKLEKLTPQWMEELKVPGVSISVIKNFEPAWSKGFGVAAAGKPAAVTGRTVFEACSMSKPVFACLVLKLVEKGTLDLDRPLCDYLDEPFVSTDDGYAKLITARMILTHTSGMPNWRKGGEEREGPLPVYFRPGSKFSYSGEGIYYLQRVVEHVTQEPLAAYAKRNLFDPLGFASTSYAWTGNLDPQIATGHDASGNCLKRSRYAHPNAAYTLYTTPDEYARIMIAIMKADRAGGFPLSGRLADEMLAPRVRMDVREVIDRPGRSLGLTAYRGLGWAIDSTVTGDIAYHSGSNQTGFTCYSQFNRREGSGIVIMTNGKNGSDLWSRLISAVGDL